MAQTQHNGLYGMLAEFAGPDELLAAAEAARKQGYTAIEGYSPMPIHGLSEALGQKPTVLPWVVFAGGLAGCGGGFGLAYWVSAIALPLNVGGRPLNSWPAFIPVTFECTILAAALTAIVSMIAMNGLPQPHHPLFNVDRFEQVTQDAFFLCVEAKDPKFDRKATREFLEGLQAHEVVEVEE